MHTEKTPTTSTPRREFLTEVLKVGTALAVGGGVGGIAHQAIGGKKDRALQASADANEQNTRIVAELRKTIQQLQAQIEAQERELEKGRVAAADLRIADAKIVDILSETERLLRERKISDNDVKEIIGALQRIIERKPEDEDHDTERPPRP